MRRKYKVLSIDAWADCTGCDHTDDSEEKCWTWNNWFTVDHTDVLPETVADFFKLLGGTGDQSDYEIEDDGYNITLKHKASQMPVYAVEYGSLS